MQIFTQPVPGNMAGLADRISAELRRMHIFSHLRGYYYLIHLLMQVVPWPGRPFAVTKQLYPDAGRSFGVSPASVERAVRTSIAACWNRGGRDVLDQMAGTCLDKCPTSAQFIGIVADYIRRTR